jgi:GT2 family glycosyltransferase
VIVDNGSSDSTPPILRAFARHLPLEVLEELKPGKNRALNVGIGALEGELFIITDDDAVPTSSFLQAWERYLHRCGKFELFGGRIEPYFEVPPPRWLLKSRNYFPMMFAERDLTEGAVAPEDIYGCNMAVRASVFARGFRFADNIGPNWANPNYPMGGETEFCRRVARSGASCWFAREPKVQHIVRPSQYCESAFARRAYRCGRGRAHLMLEEGRTMAAPGVSLLDRLAMVSPLRQHRLRFLCAYHLARGFHDECAGSRPALASWAEVPASVQDDAILRARGRVGPNSSL